MDHELRKVGTRASHKPGLGTAYGDRDITWPTEAQRRYLERGLHEAGGKLPLFDPQGRDVPRNTVEACIAHGWAEPWFRNPIKPDWLVCKLTAAGYQVLGRSRVTRPR